MKSILAALTLWLAGIAPLTAQSPVGDWSGIMHTPGADVPLNFVLKVKGDTLSGTVKRASGDVTLLGQVKKDSVTFEYTIMYSESPLLMKIHAQVKGDSLIGVVDFGGNGEGDFAVKRVPSTPVQGGGGGNRVRFDKEKEQVRTEHTETRRN